MVAEPSSDRGRVDAARGGETHEDATATVTYDRVFLAAERLFADFGFEAVSVREIVHAADSNLAAVNYHFGSKIELYLAVFRKRMRQLNSERTVLLRAAESEHADAPALEAVLRAYIAPPILWRSPAGGKAVASRFLNRAMSAPAIGLRPLLETDVQHLAQFRRALERALPRASQVEIGWALHFAAALPHKCADLPLRRLANLTQAACDIDDLPAMVDRAVSFASAGVLALCSVSRVKRQP